MEVLTRTNGREMTLAISGELDHHGAHGAMQQIDHALDAALPLLLTMDLSGVSFMDSSGIAVVYDWGRGIADVEKAREPLFTTGGEERSGMGFTIMESFMDTLKVRSRPGKGTVVTMRKRIAQRTGRA